MRSFLVVFWLLAIGLAVLEFTGHATWLGKFSSVPGILSFTLTLVAMVPLLVSGFDWFSRALLRMPLRRARRQSWRTSTLNHEFDNEAIYAALSRLVIASSRDGHATAGAVLAEGLKDAGRGVPSWPTDFPWLRDWFNRSAQAIEDSLIIRILIPERARSMTSLVRELDVTQHDFLQQRTVERAVLTHAPVPGPTSSLFSDFVTDFSGAIILIDAVQTRAGTSHGIRVWHTNRYSPETNAPGEVPATFASTHDTSHDHIGAAQTFPCQWGDELRSRSSARVGDTDGRLLELVGAALTVDPRSGDVNFMLATNETCYAATEVSRFACKGDLHRLQDASHDAPWERSRTLMRVQKKLSPNGRVNMLSVLCAVLLHSESGNSAPHRSLLLAERSSAVQHADGVLSIVGGVLTLPQGGGPGDIDDQGFASPQHAISREMREELGISLPPADFTPTVVYTYNQRSRPDGRPPRGQLLSTVAFTVQLRMTLNEVKAARASASSVSGRYEFSDLDELELPYPDQLPAAAGLPRDQQLKIAAQDVAARALTRAQRLDQASFVAILYACAEAYTYTNTIEAFNTVWKQPWSDLAWFGEQDAASSSSGSQRLVTPVTTQIDPQWAEELLSSRTSEASFE